MAEKDRSVKFSVRTGDCLKCMREHNERGSADLVVADPPFGIGYAGYNCYDDSLTGEEYVKWCFEWLIEIYHVLHDRGSFWLYIGDEHVSELDIDAKRVGFHKRSHVIHHYSFGVACQNNFSRSHTHLLYYTKSKSNFTFNADAVRVPSQRQLVYGDKRANSKGKLPDNTWVLTRDHLAEYFGSDEDTWLISRVAGTFKERQKRGTHVGKTRKTYTPQMPLAVLDRIILSTSNPGDLVIDPFLGTGTTGVSAVRAGRNFWGCDIDTVQVREARNRIRQG